MPHAFLEPRIGEIFSWSLASHRAEQIDQIERIVPSIQRRWKESHSIAQLSPAFWHLRISGILVSFLLTTLSFMIPWVQGRLVDVAVDEAAKYAKDGPQACCASCACGASSKMAWERKEEKKEGRERWSQWKWTLYILNFPRSLLELTSWPRVPNLVFFLDDLVGSFTWLMKNSAVPLQLEAVDISAALFEPIFLLSASLQKEAHFSFTVLPFCWNCFVHSFRFVLFTSFFVSSSAVRFWCSVATSVRSW